MRRILFVDDDQQVLDGLRDSLRKQRNVWDMVYASGGIAGLEKIANGSFDVVVTDMRMPGMDGAAFLREVKALSPSTARIVLSGEADRALVMQALSVSQQYLSKPCGVDTLRTIIESACNLRERLADPRVRELVGDIDALPSVPATYLRLTEMLADPRAEIADVRTIVEQDPALGAKVLQIVNSAFFGLSHSVSSIGSAVTFLGLDLVKSLAATMGIFSAAEEAVPIPGFSIEQIQQEARMVAHMARLIVRDPTHRDAAYTSGMLHDVGKIVFALRAPVEYAETLGVAAAAERPVHVVEHERLGGSHADVGAFLFGTWGLPYGIVESIAYHHSPAAAACADDDLILAVHIADGLVEAALAGRTNADTHLDWSLVEARGLSGKLDGWRHMADTLIAASNV